MLQRLLAKRHISRLDLSFVRRKVIEKLGWTSEKAEQVELEYKRFLYALARKRQEDLISPPTPEVDEFWHQHILDTRKYREDCEMVFGHYIDHTPGLRPEEQAKADVRRRQVYSKHDIDLMSFDSGDGSSAYSSGTDASGVSYHPNSSHAADGGHHTGADGGDAVGHGGGGHSGADSGGDGGGHGGGDGGGGDGGGGDGGGGDGGGGCGGG